jgi:tetratricopeptide (TPR) repeat protein
MVAELLKSELPEHRRELRSLADSFVAEYEFQDCDWGRIPEPHCFNKTRPKRTVLVHSFGAIRCLERLTTLLDSSGFILMNDYGSAEQEQEDHWFEHQRYSGGTYVGVNFNELKQYFQCDAYRFAEPAEGDDRLFSRLLGRQGLAAEVVDAFTTLFSKRSLEERSTLKARGKGSLSHQRYEGALSAYRRLLKEQPYDWISLGEVAELLAFGFREPAAGLSAIREAIAVNPSCSSHLWDIAGDCLLELEQPHEARKAFLRAIEINPDDVRARLGLARVHIATKDWSAALETLADGLACSHDRNWTQQLLSKQTEVLVELDRSHRDAYRRLANRIRQVGVLGTPRGSSDGDQSAFAAATRRHD